MQFFLVFFFPSFFFFPEHVLLTKIVSGLVRRMDCSHHV
uniref:Uncharacterized protein n=1 Tax=Rhizophora mucronata TaxID=61149 RepID=A0A2P2PQ33_RHIMU